MPLRDHIAATVRGPRLALALREPEDERLRGLPRPGPRLPVVLPGGGLTVQSFLVLIFHPVPLLYPV